MIENPRYKINGYGNEIHFIKDGQECPDYNLNGLSITITGNNNKIFIEVPTNFVSVSIIMDGDNNKITIKSTKHRVIRHTTFGIEGGSEIIVGSGISVYREMNVVAKNGKNITIGDECMFAREIMIRNVDGHVILDKKTKELLNPPEDIVIGNHVWVGMRVMILKGAVIPDGCVVGAMALVNSKFEEENLLIAGVPAKKIRSDVEWCREDYAMYMKKQG